MTFQKNDAITLEPRTTAHAEQLFAALSGAALYEFIEEEPPASVEALRQKLSRSESRRSPDGSEHWLNWVVRDADERVVGYVQATVSTETLETFVAYVIGEQFWGRGIAGRAVQRMLDIVAGEFGVTRFHVIAERRNLRSVRLAERLGFVEVPVETAVLRGIVATDILMLHERI